MAKAAAKDEGPCAGDKDSAPRAAGEAKATEKKDLQSAFSDWKRRQSKKAQPKAAAAGAAKGGDGAKGATGGAKARADDAEAKGTPSASGAGAAQAKPLAPFIAEANRPKAVRNLLDRVVDW